SSRPNSLAIISPNIENSINAEQKKFKLKMKDTILTWAGWRRTLDIRVLGVRILRIDGPPGGPTSGSLVGTIPEISFSLSGQALVQGRLAPQSIELFGPRLRVRREFDGGFGVGFVDTETKSTNFAQRLLDQLQAAPNPKNLMSYLTRLEVVSAEITLDDQFLDRSWVIPSANVSLQRNVDGIKGRVNLELDVDGRQTEIILSGVYQTALKRFDLSINFSEVSPVAFSSIYYELGPLRAFALPLKGTVTAGVTLDGKVEWAGLDLVGGKGILNVPTPIQQTLAVDKIVLRGRYEGNVGDFDLEELSLSLGDNGHLRLPLAGGHPMPLTSLTLKGKYLGHTQRLEITNAEAELQGPTASFSAVVDGLSLFKGNGKAANISVDLKGEVRDFPVNQMKKYWPKSWGSKARNWIVPNITDGIVHQARAEMRLWSGNDDIFELVSLDGDIEVTGATVNYLAPMPAVRNVNAYMKFDEKAFNIFMSQGTSENLTLREGTVIITGLDEIDQYNDIKLVIDGGFADKLAYLDHKPLGYATAIGIDPKTTKGTSTTVLKLKFLMEEATTIDTIEVTASSKVTGAAAAKALLGRNISDGKLDIEVTKKGMDLSGTVNIGKIPAALLWRENFGDKPEFRRRYDLKTRITDSAQMAEVGLDVAPFTDKFVRGVIDANVRFTIFDDIDQRLEIKTNIIDAELSAPLLGWSKLPGVPGEARITVDFEGDLIKDVPEFSIIADDLKVLGRAQYSQGTNQEKKKGVLERVDFERITYGRTDVKGALISRAEGGWDVGVYGPSFEMSPIWDEIFNAAPVDEKETDFKLPYLTMAVEIENVWIGPDRKLHNISGTFAHADDLWKTVLVKGEVSPSGKNKGDKKNKSFELTIRPGDDGNRVLVMTSNDAGETLKSMGFYENMIGGKLEIAGKYEDKSTGHPLIGKIRVTDYRVAEAPALAHALSIMSLTGILEALDGDGLSFTNLDIPFILGEGALQIKNAKATGPSLGFTASGAVYTYTDVVDISGTMVPAYAINSALGNIPLLGQIFTGGEEGGGVFAFNYSMSGSRNNPE
ncbi:MAG: AsmA-like C-terminal region-containing protein, partial [Rhodospirillales bacterium]